jgi:NhaC family Na+:H+ antiporter
VPIPLWLALMPLLFLVSMLAGSVSLFADNSSYGPNQIALLLAAGVASVIGLYLGESWHEIERAMVDGIKLALNALSMPCSKV